MPSYLFPSLFLPPPSHPLPPHLPLIPLPPSLSDSPYLMKPYPPSGTQIGATPAQNYTRHRCAWIHLSHSSSSWGLTFARPGAWPCNVLFWSSTAALLGAPPTPTGATNLSILGTPANATKLCTTCTSHVELMVQDHSKLPPPAVLTVILCGNPALPTFLVWRPSA